MGMENKIQNICIQVCTYIFFFILNECFSFSRQQKLRSLHIKPEGDWSNPLSITFKMVQSVQLSSNSVRFPIGAARGDT